MPSPYGYIFNITSNLTTIGTYFAKYHADLFDEESGMQTYVEEGQLQLNKFDEIIFSDFKDRITAEYEDMPKMEELAGVDYANFITIIVDVFGCRSEKFDDWVSKASRVCHNITSCLRQTLINKAGDDDLQKIGVIVNLLLNHASEGNPIVETKYLLNSNSYGQTGYFNKNISPDQDFFVDGMEEGGPDQEDDFGVDDWLP
jgi:hypothetical protein